MSRKMNRPGTLLIIEGHLVIPVHNGQTAKGGLVICLEYV